MSSAGHTSITGQLEAPSAPGGAREAPRATRGLVGKLLRLRLFYKLLIANAAIVALAVLVGGVLVARLGGAAELSQAVRLAAYVAGTAVVIGASCTAVLIRLALAPLRELERTAGRVEDGDLETRAALSSLADADMHRLVLVFNRMLDRLERYRSRQREVTVRSLEAEEKARAWVARQLYDECAQSLAAVLLQLRATGGRLGESEQAKFDKLRAGVLKALENVRQVARELRPPELEEIGLTAALAAQVRTLSERRGIDIRLDADSLESELGSNAGLALYRIVQEALANAARHAGARRIEVRVSRHADGVEAEVVDDGIGFDVDAELERAGRGLGLLEMRERALHVGAKLSIESGRGTGTRVLVHLPRESGRLEVGEETIEMHEAVGDQPAGGF